MEYHPKGNLQSNLVDIGNKTWHECVGILCIVALGLKTAHEKDIIHCDLHSGNVLFHDYYQPYIADFGLSKVADSSVALQNKKGSYGVIPYMAPELFKGQPHSKETDIYAFGIIMWEISAGEQAFIDRNHGIHLIIDICNGLRPQIIEGTPDDWIQLMKQCWDSDPQKRPTAHKIRYQLFNWGWKESNTIEFKNADKYKKQHPKAHSKQSHLGAVYHSRFIPHITRTVSTKLHNTNYNQDMFNDDE